MPTKRLSSAQIISIFRKADVHLVQGMRFPRCLKSLESTTNVLQVASTIWWFAYGSVEMPERTGEGKFPARKAAGRVGTG